MNTSAFSRLAILAFLSGSLLVSGCNSKSGLSDDKPQRDTNNDTVAEGVTGPLDLAQAPLYDQVIGQLVSATAGTPLEGTMECIGQAVVLDVIDVVDAIALALQGAASSGDPTAAFDGATENIQFALNELAHDLPGALTALAGEDCNSPSGSGLGAGFTGGDNPLAGTPLESLGASLGPVFEQLGGESGQDLDLQSLSELVHELSTAFATGTAQVPAEVQDAPIFGGLLTTLQVALDDLDSTLDPLSMYDGENAAAELEITLNNLLDNLLTEVVPVNFIEAQSDQQGAISGPIQDAVDQITAALGDNLLDAGLPPLSDALDGPLATLLDPVENQLLPAILGPITEALGGSTVDGPTGTSLDLILAQLTNALATGTRSTPLDALLTPLLGSLGTGGGCPLAGTPLEAVCDLLV